MFGDDVIEGIEGGAGTVANVGEAAEMFEGADVIRADTDGVTGDAEGPAIALGLYIEFERGSTLG